LGFGGQQIAELAIEARRDGTKSEDAGLKPGATSACGSCSKEVDFMFRGSGTNSWPA